MLIVMGISNIADSLDNLSGLFEFYDCGLHGILRDTVLLTEYDRHSDDLILDDQFISSVINKYHNSGECVLQVLSENTHNSTLIELALHYVADRVKELLKSVFAGYEYEIKKHDWSWIGSDLLVEIV